MRRPLLLAACAALCLTAALPATAPAQPGGSTWDNLVQVKSKQMKYVYLLPGADFKQYTKVMLDPTEVAFEKNFMRNFNSGTRGLSRRLTDKDLAKAKTQVAEAVKEIFTKAYTEGGYTVVTEPGPDVLQLRTGIVNLYVNAPDLPTAGRSNSFAAEAGKATIILEARDSDSGALLGRAVDGRIAGDMGGFVAGSLRSSVSNRADFEQIFKIWAKSSVKGLNTLKTSGPAGVSVANK
jgi:hypothetical protein